MRFFVALLLLAAPLCAQTEIDRLQAEIARVRSDIATLRNAGEETPELATRLGKDVFSWTTGDGKFTLRLETIVQATLTGHDVRAQGGKGGDNGRDFLNFRVPYTRIQFAGNIFEKDFLYKVEITPIGEDGRFGFEEVYFRYQPLWAAGLLVVTIGQRRSPFSYEESVDRTRRMFTRKSVANSAFNQGFAKGIDVSGAADLWAARVLQWNFSVSNGVVSGKNAQGSAALIPAGSRANGANVTNPEDTEALNGGFRNDDRQVFNDGFDQFVDADLMVQARFEFHGMGEMPLGIADMRGAEENGDWKFMVGLAASYFNARVDGRGTFLDNSFRLPQGIATAPVSGSRRLPLRAEMLSLTADGHFRGFGFFVNWALFYRKTEFHNHGPLEGSNLISPYMVSQTQDTGFTLEFGYYLEVIRTVIATRASSVNFDEFGSRALSGQNVDGDAFGPDTMEYGGSLSWCIHGDHLKLVLDYRYVVQQMPHGVDKGKNALSGTERVSDYRNFQEFRLMLQWIF